MGGAALPPHLFSQKRKRCFFFFFALSLGVSATVVGGAASLSTSSTTTRTAVPNTSSTPLRIFALHSRYALAPICCRSASPCVHQQHSQQCECGHGVCVDVQESFRSKPVRA